MGQQMIMVNRNADKDQAGSAKMRINLDAAMQLLFF